MITTNSTDAEIAIELQLLEQRKKNRDLIELSSNAFYFKALSKSELLKALCSECLLLREEVAELRKKMEMSE